MRTKAFLIIMIALLVVPAVADAQNWILRARYIAVNPKDSSASAAVTPGPPALVRTATRRP